MTLCFIEMMVPYWYCALIVCINSHQRSAQTFTNVFYSSSPPSKYRSISLSALHECPHTQTEWEWSYSSSHCTNYRGKSHSSVAVRNSRGKCYPVSYVGLPSWHCLSCPSCDHQILLPSLTAEETEAGPNWLLVLQTLKSLQKEKLGRSLAEDTPGYCEDITNWGTCILWLFFLTLGHMQGNNWWESKGGKNSYSSGALTEGIRMWGHLRRPQNKKSQTSFYPFVLHFPLCGSCSPLSSPSPSLPSDSGRRGQGE